MEVYHYVRLLHVINAHFIPTSSMAYNTQPYFGRMARRNITSRAARQAEVERGAEAEELDTLEMENDEDESEGRPTSNSAEMLETYLRGLGAPFKTPEKPTIGLETTG